MKQHIPASAQEKHIAFLGATGSGYSAGPGNFQNILGGLRSLCIIDYPRAGAAEITGWAKEILA